MNFSFIFVWFFVSANSRLIYCNLSKFLPFFSSMIEEREKDKDLWILMKINHTGMFFYMSLHIKRIWKTILNYTLFTLYIWCRFHQLLDTNSLLFLIYTLFTLYIWFWFHQLLDTNSLPFLIYTLFTLYIWCRFHQLLDTNSLTFLIYTLFTLYIWCRFHQLLDTNSLPFFLFSASNRWLAVRLDLLCVIVVAVTGFLAILTNIPPALAGMALAFSVQVSGGTPQKYSQCCYVLHPWQCYFKISL